ncbi:unnamed protein product [Phytophthora fragariaefolia]|uniref:Unnamed protein product n=1 Tax=Phytophthora fragariaefolia TaxID=1490495 RepID=A0A9W6XV67_9STRA|nr:unnamed protein product [Phytophthora fragariaefolia]
MLSPTTTSAPVHSTAASSAGSVSQPAVPVTPASSTSSGSSESRSSTPIAETPASTPSTNLATAASSTEDAQSSSRSSSSPNSNASGTIRPSRTSTDSTTTSNTPNEAPEIAEGSNTMPSLATVHPRIATRRIGGSSSGSDSFPMNPTAFTRSTSSDQSASSSLASAIVGDGDSAMISNAGDESKVRSDGRDDEDFHRAIIDFTHSLAPARDIASNSANILVASAVTSNVVSVAISIVTTSTSAVSTATSGVAASNGVLNVIGAGAARMRAPVVDLTGLFMMLNYLQFISSSSHLSLPTAPDFFFHFTDSLGWCNFQPTGTPPPPPTENSDVGKQKLSSENASNFTVADGDIISGVLAYAERINVKPEELFTKTAIVFVSVVGGVAAVVATLYSLLRFLLRRQLELLIQRLDDLPRAKLLMRLLIQSCLSICLLSEYALSMTSSFQLRYNEQQHHGSHSAFAFATVALTLVCCGLIVLGIVKIWGKTEDELSNADFKFAWGAYYKYYHFENRYFFVAKMGAEILSGVIIGLVSDVPSQLTLLMSLQLAMFLYTIESAPYSMEFQTVCSSIAFVMKMVTYALISSFLTPSTDENLQDFVGTLVITLQVTLLVLFNSRQLYILYKQMKYLWELRQNRLRRKKEIEGEKGDAMVIRNSAFALTPAPVTQATGTQEGKYSSTTATPTLIPVAAG